MHSCTCLNSKVMQSIKFTLNSSGKCHFFQLILPCIIIHQESILSLAFLHTVSIYHSVSWLIHNILHSKLMSNSYQVLKDKILWKWRFCQKLFNSSVTLFVASGTSLCSVLSPSHISPPLEFNYIDMLQGRSSEGHENTHCYDEKYSSNWSNICTEELDGV